MRRLGQHWMTNPAGIRAIVDALELSPGDTVVEIGPGRGALTDALLQKTRDKDQGTKVIAVEKDAALAEKLRERYAADKNITVTIGDALTVIPELASKFKNQNSKFKIVGNIPYYITGALLRLLSELEHPPERAVLTIQKDVALRLTAAPPKMNLLAAAIQYAARITIIKHLSPGSFSPPPKVSSSIILLDRFSQPTATAPVGGARPALLGGAPDKNAAAYYEFIHAAFKQPRKKLSGNLRARYGTEKTAEAFRALGLPDNIRPHQLSLVQLKQLAAALCC